MKVTTLHQELMSLGIGMREDFLQLAVGRDTSICLSLVPFKKEDEFLDSMGHSQSANNEHTHSDSSALVVINEKDVLNENNFGVPSPAGLEIYLMHIFHKNSVVRLKEENFSASRAAVAGQVSRIPYVQLLFHPPWHSRTSSWSLSLKFPESVFHSACLSESSNNYDVKGLIRAQFHTKIMVKDDQVTVSGEGAPSIFCSFGIPPDVSSVGSYGCDLDDLPLILLLLRLSFPNI